MAKKKTTGYDRVVMVTKDGSEWTIHEWKFLFTGMAGVNMAVQVKGKWQPITYARDLKEAGYFAEGFVAGVEAVPKLSELQKLLDA